MMERWQKRVLRSRHCPIHAFTPWGRLEHPFYQLACFWEALGNRKTQKKPIQILGEHAELHEDRTKPKFRMEPGALELQDGKSKNNHCTTILIFFVTKKQTNKTKPTHQNHTHNHAEEKSTVFICKRELYIFKAHVKHVIYNLSL